MHGHNLRSTVAAGAFVYVHLLPWCRVRGEARIFLRRHEGSSVATPRPGQPSARPTGPDGADAVGTGRDEGRWTRSIGRKLDFLGVFRREHGDIAHVFLVSVPPDFLEAVDASNDLRGRFYSRTEIDADPRVLGLARARLVAAFAEIDRRLAVLA
jgi:hypothetical protein